MLLMLIGTLRNEYKFDLFRRACAVYVVPYRKYVQLGRDVHARVPYT